jgi:hypothetical protein
LIPSKYKENLYQSLTGVNYLLDHAKKHLIRRLPRGKRSEKFEVIAQDIHVTLHGQSFQKLIVNKILDRRSQEALRLRRASSMDQHMSIEGSIQIVNEYFKSAV